MNGAQQEHVALIRDLATTMEPVPTGYPTRIAPVRADAVIFDVYGTLLTSAAGDVGVDAAEDDERAFRLALADGGWPGVAPEVSGRAVELLRREIVREHTVRRRQGIEYPEVDILAIWRRVLAGLSLAPPGPGRSLRRLSISYECRTNPVWPMPGLAELLRALRGRVELGILSNAQFYTPLLFSAFLGKDPEALGFSPDLCLWSYREEEGKPSPTLFRRLDERLQGRGIAPADVLYVGNDMLKDILPAAQVGWRTVLFAGDARSLRLREGNGLVAGVRPDMVIDRLAQLLQILQ
ncbi:MAG TPA: HAD family hydrolase [Desulfobulbus sp.]|nr:HAD family hydrolase [Desulfobulbus sp.]